MAQVTSKKDTLTAQPYGQPAVDLWADFRAIERLTLELAQTYTHSLGKVSRFFIELENRRFMATRCESCAQVYAPPRPLCPHCHVITKWYELPGTGTVETFSILHFSPATNPDVKQLALPYVLAYVLLDGATTLFPHLLDAPPDSVSIGLRVRVQYVAQPVFHPIHLMRFVPLESS
jgi:uncharacterized protein